MVLKIALAALFGALLGLAAATSTRLNPAQVTLVDDARTVAIVQAAWQGRCHER